VCAARPKLKEGLPSKPEEGLTSASFLTSKKKKSKKDKEEEEEDTFNVVALPT
jgi:hypothetical protein